MVWSKNFISGRTNETIGIFKFYKLSGYCCFWVAALYFLSHFPLFPNITTALRVEMYSFLATLSHSSFCILFIQCPSAQGLITEAKVMLKWLLSFASEEGYKQTMHKKKEIQTSLLNSGLRKSRRHEWKGGTDVGFCVPHAVGMLSDWAIEKMLMINIQRKMNQNEIMFVHNPGDIRQPVFCSTIEMLK